MRSRTSRELLIAAVVLAAAFVALLLWIRYQGPLAGDRRVHDWVAGRGVPRQSVSDLYSLFGAVGTPAGGAFVTLTIALVALYNVGARNAGLVLAAVLIGFAEKPIANLAGQTQSAAQAGIPAGGFPSGHALFTASVLGMTAWLGHHHGRLDVTVVSLTVILLTGVTRVLSGAHLPSEVLGGYLLGAAWLCLVLAVDRRRAAGRRS